MAFEIRSTVNTPAANNFSTEKAAAPSVSVAESEGSAAPLQNFSVTSAESKRPDAGQSGGSENGNGKEPTEKQVRSTINHANNELKHAKTGLDFKYHEATRRVSITVYDKDTKEVIREIPPEKSLDMLEKMWELAGMVVDDRR